MFLEDEKLSVLNAKIKKFPLRAEPTQSRQINSK